MPIFTLEGDHKFSNWLIDGLPNFSVIPANTISGITNDMPIRLQYGDGYFGSTHITARHGKWLQRYQPNGCVATFVHKKLSTSGKILLLEQEQKKIGLALTLSPSSALILSKQKNFFSVTTIYYKNKLEGEDINARYLGYLWATSPYVQTQR